MSAQALFRHWRVKAVLQKALSPLPGHQQLNYLLQTRVVRSIPVNEQRLVDAVRYSRQHRDAYVRHQSSGPSSADATFWSSGRDGT